MLKKLANYIGIGKIGWLELIIAIYPILAGYGYGIFKLSFGVLFILDVIILCRYNRKSMNIPLKALLFFLVIHDLLFMTVIPEIPSYYINSLIGTIIYIASIFIIAPQLDFNKLKSAIYIVSIVCMGGMIYHVLLLSQGMTISPIKVPFLPDMQEMSRLFSINERPSSFFWEPQAYVSFMLVPLYLTLRERKLLFAFIIAVTMFLSTSTTGLILSVLMIITSSIFKRGEWFSKLLGVVVVISLLYFLMYSSYTVDSLEKLENTDLGESNRIINGYLVVTDLSFLDFLLGIPFPNEQYAYDNGYFHVPLIVMADGVLFISAIWISLIRYGIIGLLLFLYPYYWVYKQDSKILPYLLCIVIVLFSNPDFISSPYVFQFLIMLVIVAYDKKMNVPTSIN